MPLQANKAVTVLKKLQKHDLKTWEVNLWLVKRRLSGKDAVYSVIRVETDKKLNQRLRRVITSKLLDKALVLEEYEFLSADQDNRVFTLEADQTDFVQIEREIKQGINNPKATKYEDLLDSWGLVIEVSHKGEAIYGMRKISALTQTKKVASLTSLLFQNSLLVDLSDQQVFTLDLNIDFFVSDGFVFITHKKEFESVLNFRKGMEENRDSVLDEFTALELFSDITPLREHIGINLHHLRKISMIQKSGYYKDKKYIADLIHVNKAERWGLAVVDGKILVSAENAEVLMTLLSNSRLKSPINQEVFDAIVKKKVS